MMSVIALWCNISTIIKNMTSIATKYCQVRVQSLYFIFEFFFKLYKIKKKKFFLVLYKISNF